MHKMSIYNAQTGIDFDGCVIALGNFDGVHTAHEKILANCVGYAREHNIKCGVLLFDRHSAKTTHSREISLITTQNQKLGLIEAAGIDFVYMRPFDDEFMKKSPEEFVQMLIKNLRVRAVCVGYDYRFGYRATGDTTLLIELGKKYGIDVVVAPPVKIDGEIVSSTLIRDFVKNGETEKAKKFLSRPFFVEGEVVKGKQNGRKIGFPTANVAYDNDMLLPKAGVYAGITTVGEKRYKCVINVGNNPTFNADKVTIESHIFDFDADIYGDYIKVEFIKYLRSDVKFGTIEQLKAQIEKDVENAKNMCMD